MAEPVVGEVRVVPHGDASRILKFYADNPDPEKNILPRPAAIQEAVEKGHGVEGLIGGETVAASVVYLTEAGTRPRILELGTSRVADAWRGGWHSILFGGRFALVAQAFGRDLTDPTRLKLVTAAKPDNLRSVNGILSAGFEHYESVEAPLLSACATCLKPPGKQSPRSCCCDFFQLPHHKFLSKLKDFVKSESFPLRPVEGRSEVRIESRILTDIDRISLLRLLGD